MINKFGRWAAATLCLTIAAAPRLSAQTDHAGFAENSTNSFVELSVHGSTRTFDLRTLHLIDPGRFTVVQRIVDAPDVIDLRLKVLEILRTYCGRSDGQYPAPRTLFALGVPDLPVQPINVESNRRDVETLGAHLRKFAGWDLPYRRLAAGKLHGRETVFCHEPNDDASRSVIFNGIQLKVLYDCRRSLEGDFIDLNDEASRAVIHPIRAGTVAEALYLTLCRRVTGKEPYRPN